MTRILVIKLGALGDLVQAFAPFAAIRAHHPTAEVTLLTTAPFAGLMRAAPWFDRVVVDARPPWWNLAALVALRRVLSGHDMVYDLQTSGRSSRYFRLAGRPAWSGIAAGASRPHDNPQRNYMHTRARQRDQLRRAGIADVPDADLSWLATGGPVLPDPYALLVPGAAPHRPAKRWPAERFGGLARRLRDAGVTPVVVGTQAEAPLAAVILAACPEARDLTGRTSLAELAGLAARARLAVGNDTGPMHLAAAMGCPATVLFSRDSDPSLTAPLGHVPGQVRVIRVDDLATLSVERVAASLG
ncbi:lipopolysaccharide heptosyltransferase [Gluconacetobacter johannae DSM 13595]|uniref:Glycosyltransferase family 9 protein n=1 Tax=Gluconacetobacter johannae TaxID=112140 RepID=A0A7W4J6Y2_9PROT|nr:glycosyltransferase family 9 protein [Gluconacetobacter johannae]MBB2175562.1 glycosyltransferase family 9 protein [Gluconacetobacter johannae]GBQ83645.1 lipopolysaccharide heptosyltransferase [Gluconacetobacter johannae DSM 13595]